MHNDIETQEWLDALDSLVKYAGKDKASDIIKALSEQAATAGVDVPSGTTTPYINSIPPEKDLPRIGDPELDKQNNCNRNRQQMR